MLSPESIVAVHDKGTVQLELSFHQKWITSAGSDGRLHLRLVENQVRLSQHIKFAYCGLVLQVGQLV